MSYSEYEQMTLKIEEQDKLIEELKKGDNVILIDERRGTHGSYPYSFLCFPYLVMGEKLAKEYIQEEFNALSRRLEMEMGHLKSEGKSRKSWLRFW